MTIKKIKVRFNNNADTNILKNESFSKMEITHITKNNNTNNKTLTTSPDLPNPTFMDKFNELRDYANQICELETDTGILRVTGINFKSTNDELSVGIIAHKKIEYSSSPLNLNTPYIEADSMPDGLQELAEELIDLAEAYIKGDRAQQQLPGFNETEAEEETETEDEDEIAIPEK